jgi:glyoxylase-like metal-dependent hydrolase (beta-lactamase superfamily II)
MILRQFLDTDPVVAASYLIGCGGQSVAAVIDPVGDPLHYREAAAEHGMSIRYVIDTHIHADHLSSGRGIAASVGAEYLLGPGNDGAAADYRAVDGEILELGNVSLQVIHTPGHTPEHVTLLVTDGTRGPEPWAAVTGHTLMAGDMGRTELAGDPSRGAQDLFDSAERLRTLPDHVLVLPGAFSGSVCGRGLSGNPISTIGFERRFNRAFRMTSRDEFVRFMLSNIPKPPPDAAATRATNMSARAGVEFVPMNKGNRVGR